jgi:hypothetical protein
MPLPGSVATQRGSTWPWAGPSPDHQLPTLQFWFQGQLAQHTETGNWHQARWEDLEVAHPFSQGLIALWIKLGA